MTKVMVACKNKENDVCMWMGVKENINVCVYVGDDDKSINYHSISAGSSSSESSLSDDDGDASCFAAVPFATPLVSTN